MLRRPLALAAALFLAVTLAGCSALFPTGSQTATSPTPSAESAPAPAPAEESNEPDRDESSATGQTVAEACAIVAAAGQESGELLSDTDAMSDPAALVANLEQAARDMGAAIDQIDNAEVEAAAVEVRDAFVLFGDVAKAVLIDGDQSRLGELTDFAADLPNSFTELTSLCATAG